MLEKHIETERTQFLHCHNVHEYYYIYIGRKEKRALRRKLRKDNINVTLCLTRVGGK